MIYTCFSWYVFTVSIRNNISRGQTVSLCEFVCYQFGDRSTARTMAYICPKLLADGGFLSWLHHSKCCALANGWDEPARLAKQPAFLQGPTATYFEFLTADQKATNATLIDGPKVCFCQEADCKRYHSEFKITKLRPSEDHSV